MKKFWLNRSVYPIFSITRGMKNGEISFTGGQLASCRDVARFGQLIVNRGKWKMPDGRVRQLVSSSFIDEIATPAFPAANRFYGLGGYVYNSVSNESRAQRGERGRIESWLECGEIGRPVLAWETNRSSMFYLTQARSDR